MECFSLGIQVTHADISFNEQGTPNSSKFDDVYYSNDDGLAESNYVFIEGNQLSDRWLEHKCQEFCIGETGFGTGLNFLATASLFRQFRNRYPNHCLQNLRFISVEKFPLKKQDAEQIYAKWPLFSEFSSLFIEHYPASIKGVHRIHFDSGINLDLHFGDATESLCAIKQNDEGLVDAWFLDGFAPSKNDQMWTPQLFETMAQLTKVGGTLATFTAAGKVKRGLQAVGFDIKKRKGFGRKREMIIGQLHQTTQKSAKQAPYFYRYSSNELSTQSPARIAVVGNGLAGAITALKLIEQGLVVDLFWQGSEPADAASGAPIGGFYPQLNAQHNHASRLQLASFLYASNFYKQLNQRQTFDHSWCGALQIAFNENTRSRLEKLAMHNYWPESVAKIVNAEQASKIANIDLPYDSLFLPSAGWISPHSLVSACIKLAAKSGSLNLHSETKLTNYRNDGHKQILTFTQHDVAFTHKSDILILATGSGSADIYPDLVPLRLTRGQIEIIEASETTSQLQTLLCHKGYFTPANRNIHAFGSTYVKNDSSTDSRANESRDNFDLQLKTLNQSSWINAINDQKDISKHTSRAGVRCSSPDHLPIVGMMPSSRQLSELCDLYKAKPIYKYPRGSQQNNVYALTALGSRGLTTAPLMAEILVSQIVGRALPLENDLLDALSPNRFLVRKLIRREY